ncbi:MAG: hypothetical protein II200_06085 [Bacteroidaceae bacterium]|nr:hypothetical protein [Bacteroidaceae bacterium]
MKQSRTLIIIILSMILLTPTSHAVSTPTPPLRSTLHSVAGMAPSVGSSATSPDAQADNYSAWWEDVRKYMDADLPQSARQPLTLIESKALRTHNAAQLLAATLTSYQIASELSPDSAEVVSNLLRLRAEHELRPIQRILWQAARAKLLSQHWNIPDWREESRRCWEEVFSHPETLHAATASDWLPLFVLQPSSWHFNNDLLHVLLLDALQSPALAEADRQALCNRIAHFYQSRCNESAALYLSLYYGDVKTLASTEPTCPMGIEAYIQLLEQMPQSTNAELAQIVKTANEAISRYPQHPRTAWVRNLLRRLTQPSLQVSAQEFYAYPGKEQTVSIVTNNIARLQWMCYEASTSQTTPSFVVETRIPQSEPWENIRTSVALTFPNVGRYVCRIVADGAEMAHFNVDVTRLRPIYLPQPGASTRIIAVNSHSGAPISDFAVAEYTQDTLLHALHYPDATGAVFITPSAHTRHRYSVVAEGDSLSPGFRCHRYSLPPADERRTLTALFTDRAIYHAGQEVKFAGTCFWQQADSSQVLAYEPVRLRVEDTQGQVLTTLSLTTDKNGDFNGTFQLPTTTRPGFCVVLTEGGDWLCNFRVEAYRRPTFSVQLLAPKVAYAAGDSLLVSGKVHTYSGASLAGAAVRYRLRDSYSPRYNQTNSLAAQGEVFVQSDGSFHLPISLPKPTSDNAQPSWRRQSYTLEADVIAPSGELQTATYHLPVSIQSAFLSAQWPTTMLRERPTTLNIALRNAVGTTLPIDLAYTIYDAANNTTLTGTTTSGQAMTPTTLSTLPDGHYRLEVVHEWADTLKLEFSVISETSRRPLPSSPFFFHSEHSAEGDSVMVLCGTSYPDATIFYDETDENGAIVAHRRFLVSDSLMCFRLAYDHSRGKGFTVHFYTMRAGRLHYHNVNVVAPPPPTKLKLNWTTFRNLSQPGAEEEWTLRISNPDDTPAKATLVATLYDASLDAYRLHRWNMPISYHRNLAWTRINTIYPGRPYVSASKAAELEPVPELSFTKWDERWFNYHYAPPMRAEQTVRLRGANSTMLAAKSADASADELREVVVSSGANASAEATQLPLTIRKDFSETAFFTASAATDEQGCTTLRFKLPEATTTWRFLAIAHDARMRWGMLIDTLEVRKPLMVQAALPQFAYEGDSLAVPLTLTNLTDTLCEGILRIAITDATTGAAIVNRTEPFALKANTSEVTTALLHIPFGSTGIDCRFTAHTANASDGEAHRLNIRSQMVEQTTSIPFSMTQAGTHRIALTELWPTSTRLTQPQISVKLTPNALREAVGSLAVLANEQTPSADAAARRYYATSAALWWNQLHPLATPAQLDSLRSQQAESIERLRQTLHPDGGWGWMQGMAPNFMITTEVCLQLARTQLLTADAAADTLLHTVLPTLADIAKRRVAAMRRREAAQHREQGIGNDLLRYLQLAAQLRLPQTDTEHYLLAKAKRLGKELTLYGRATMSLITRYAGDPEAADHHLRSLREHAVHSAEMGMYFDSYRAQRLADSYRLTTQVAAIEALAHAGDTASVLAMKQWLLQSKRTQLWTSTSVTADVVHALLACGPSVTGEMQPTDVPQCSYTFYQAERRLSPEAVSAAPQQATHLAVQTEKSGLAWGSVQATFKLPQSEVQAHSSGLSIEQTWEVEHNGQWTALTEQTPLKVGQRLRRTLTIKADRDFDFVAINAPRAAALQPYQPRSGYQWTGHLPAYRALYEGATAWYVEHMPKGKHTFTEVLSADRQGTYSNGIPTVACTYAPEFVGNAPNAVLTIK